VPYRAADPDHSRLSEESATLTLADWIMEGFRDPPTISKHYTTYRYYCVGPESAGYVQRRS